MSIDVVDLNKIDKLKISNEDKSFLSVIAQYANGVPRSKLQEIVENRLSGDALAVAEEVIRLSELGKTTQASKGAVVQMTRSRSGVNEFARVLVEWAASQGHDSRRSHP